MYAGECIVGKQQSLLSCLFCCSHIIDLPQEFIDYLHADGLVLPDSCEETFDRTDFEGDSDDEVRFLLHSNMV